ncbi:hypothetical protein [Halomonas sp. C05BenzN]|uniref:hypothetical protein n=1 Tax=Halomonas sp. C05BenzN TaxID=3411041 RepID=UPI003B964539
MPVWLRCITKLNAHEKVLWLSICTGWFSGIGGTVASDRLVVVIVQAWTDGWVGYPAVPKAARDNKTTS